MEDQEVMEPELDSSPVAEDLTKKEIENTGRRKSEPPRKSVGLFPPLARSLESSHIQFENSYNIGISIISLAI